MDNFYLILTGGSIDFDDDGVRDIINNPVDAIGSVAIIKEKWLAKGCKYCCRSKPS